LLNTLFVSPACTKPMLAAVLFPFPVLHFDKVNVLFGCDCF
jgi:hypothetical protein